MTRSWSIPSLFFILIFTSGVFACPPKQPLWDSHGARGRAGAETNEPLQMDTDREYLVKDALSWMNFRVNGKLLTKAELDPLFKNIRSKYLESNSYKTFVIAFQHGVLPKLTLNEGDGCDPQYISKYREPSNFSVTHYYQKQFIFDNFNGRLSFSAYCDYRQGLVCDPDSKKCQCPSGSKMEEVDPSLPSTKRCVVQEDEICALIDWSHSLNQGALLDYLPHMIFNLERPPSCKSGTQCRFKDQVFPKCYPNSDSASFKSYQGDESMDKLYGRKCTLGLLAQPGMCEPKKVFPEFHPHGYICYNFWGREGYSKKLGFCANEYGKLGQIRDRPDPVYKAHHPFMAYFVSPKTTPFKGKKMHEYFLKLVETYRYFNSGRYQWKQGGPCKVDKTVRFLELYKFYAGLEGAANVPSESTLQAKLDELVAIFEEADKGEEKVCNIVWRFEHDGGMVTKVPPFTCQSTGAPSEPLRNDGTCQEDSASDLGREHNDMCFDNIDRLLLIDEENSNEELNYDKTILDRFPDVIRPTTTAPPPPPPAVPLSGKENVAATEKSGAFDGKSSNVLFVMIVARIFEIIIVSFCM